MCTAFFSNAQIKISLGGTIEELTLPVVTTESPSHFTFAVKHADDQLLLLLVP